MRPTAPTRTPTSGVVRALVPVTALTALMWLSEILDTVLSANLDQFGIRPRRIDGLDGVAFAPFLHDGFGHLFANTVPFAVMGAVISMASTRQFIRATLIIAAVSGLGVWLTAPPNSITVGASGLVFGYLTYLVSRGIFARRLTYLLMGLATLFVYGGVLWGLVPRPGISWQGHLFGAIGGVLAAWYLHARRNGSEPRPDDPDEPLVLGWS